MRDRCSRTTLDLHAKDSPLLVERDQTLVPWVPLTPALLLPYHLEFERIPLTFCPRNKRKRNPSLSLSLSRSVIFSSGRFDIELVVPPRRVVSVAASSEGKKRRKKLKKKRAQLKKKSETTN